MTGSKIELIYCVMVVATAVLAGGGEVHRLKQLHQLQLHGSLIRQATYRTHKARLVRALCVSAVNYKGSDDGELI